MIYIFVIWSIIMITIDYRYNRKAINIVSSFTMPYVFVIVGNKVYGERIGFYPISDDVIFMLILGLTAIFLGSLTISIRKTNSSKFMSFNIDNVNEYLGSYKMNSMIKYVIFAELCIAVRFYTLFRSIGLSGIISSEQAELIGGIFGHLFLTAFPLAPILFLYWLKNKKRISYLIVFLVFIGFLALSFVKYHVISMLLLCYLFVSFEDKKYVKKGLIILLAFVVALFVGNYIIDFFITNRLSSVNKQFYANHLWKYIAGSVIHSNQIFTTGVNKGQGTLFKVLYCVASLPGMFYYGITGHHIEWPFHLNMDYVSYNGEASNVVDFIGFMYPSNGNILSIVAFFLVFFFLGMFYQYIYNRTLKNKRGFVIPLYVMMTFFMFLSFFGNYYSLSMPWEILVWSMIMPNLFNYHAKVKFVLGHRKL